MSTKKIFNKKTQITLFIIIGLFILLLFILFNRALFKKATQNNRNFDFTALKNSFEFSVQQCLKISTEKTIERYGLNYLDEQLEYYLEKKFNECLNVEDFKKKGLNIEYTFFDINLTKTYLDEEEKILIITELNTNLTIKYENQKLELKNKVIDLKYSKDYIPKNLVGFNPIYRGIFYKYEEINDPRPLHIFVVKVDLYDPTLRFYVTPKIAPNVMTTSDFLRQNNLQLAINGGGFDIGNTNEVNGFAAYDGKPYSNPEFKPDVTLFVSEDNQIYMMPNMPNNYKYAISGFNHIIENGKILDRFYKGNPQHKEGYDYLNPRTSIGLDENEKWLNIIVVDGRNPGISEGVSALELGEIHLKYGSTNMINMDGGGSTTLVIEENSVPRIINTLSDGSERAVANHFGVWAEKLPSQFSFVLNFPNLKIDYVDFDDIPKNKYTQLSTLSNNENIVLFREINSNIAAGAQPSQLGYQWLASKGYKTVLDLQGIDNSYIAKKAGLEYIHLPYPGAKESWMNNVLSVLQDSDNYPIFVHCKYGQHRTGLAIALYRMKVDGWCFDKAFNELMYWADNYFPGTETDKQEIFNLLKKYSSC